MNSKAHDQLIRNQRIEELLGKLCQPKELADSNTLQNSIADLIKIGEPASQPTIDALRENPEECWDNLRKVLKGIGNSAIPSLMKALADEQNAKTRLFLKATLTDITETFGRLEKKKG